MIEYSSLANSNWVVLRVIPQLPGGGTGEVWVVHVLPSPLQPSDGLHLFMAEEEGGLEAEVLGDQHEDAKIEAEAEAPIYLDHTCM